MYSHWEKKYWFDQVDFTIVGSGLVGLFTAYFLSKRFPDKKIRIIERSPIPQGASTKNAGFACFGTVGEILDDLSSISEQEVIETIALRYRGLQLLQQIIDPNTIAYRNCGAYEMFVSEENYNTCFAQIAKVNRLVYQAIGVQAVFEPRPTNAHFSFYKRSIYNRLESQLNPVLLTRQLRSILQSRGVELSSGIAVKEIQAVGRTNLVVLAAEELSYKSKQVIITNNAFASELVGDLDLIPVRNQVIVSQPFKTAIPEATYHYDKGYIYFRNVENNRLLIGGARNIDPKTETSSLFEVNSKIVTHLKQFAEKFVLHEPFVIDSHWSGIMGVGSSKQPIIKVIRPGLSLGVRLGGMGVAIGSAVGQKLASISSPDG